MGLCYNSSSGVNCTELLCICFFHSSHFSGIGAAMFLFTPENPKRQQYHCYSMMDKTTMQYQ